MIKLGVFIFMCGVLGLGWLLCGVPIDAADTAACVLGHLGVAAFGVFAIWSKDAP